MHASSSSQDSVAPIGKANPVSIDGKTGRPEEEASPAAKAGNTVSAVQETADSDAAADIAHMDDLSTEADHLRTEREGLVARLGSAQQQLAEARKAIDQKEGHLQGLQASAVIVCAWRSMTYGCHLYCCSSPSLLNLSADLFSTISCFSFTSSSTSSSASSPSSSSPFVLYCSSLPT